MIKPTFIALLALLTVSGVSAAHTVAGVQQESNTQNKKKEIVALKQNIQRDREKLRGDMEKYRQDRKELAAKNWRAIKTA